MATYFDKVRTIVLDKGTKKSKIERLQSECRCTAYEAETFYNSLFAELSLMRAADRVDAKLRFTIGVEIECFGLNKERVIAAIEARGLKAYETGYNHDDSKTHYKLGYDGSINGPLPCEVVSPILKNLKSLKEVCEVINEAGAQVNKSCGLHIHFGAEKFTNAQWRRIVLNYAAIEEVIDSFMPESRRGDNNRYCRSIADPAGRIAYTSLNADMRSLQSAFGFDRYYKVNLMAYNNHKTIEFRQHSGTTDYTKIKNWIDFLTAFLTWSLKHEEIISARSIDELPFLSESQKRYYNERKATLQND